MAQYTASWKNCATCAYWIGQRDCDHFNQNAIVLSPTQKGVCRIPQGPWRHMDKSANDTCSSYMKWPVLK